MDKMMNKKGQFFALYLVVLTVVMMAATIVFYHYQNEKVQNSLVSPAPLLELYDNKEIFELQEKNLIYVSAKEAKQNHGWGSAEFVDSFKTIFFNYLLAEEQQDFRDFLFSDLKFEGQEIEKSAFSEPGSQIAFFNKVYPREEIKMVEGDGKKKLKITRNLVGKHFELIAPKRANKINFPVEVEHVYEKTYLIPEGDIG